MLLCVLRPGWKVCEEHCLQGLLDPEDPGSQAQDQVYCCGTVTLRGCSEEFDFKKTRMPFGKEKPHQLTLQRLDPIWQLARVSLDKAS